MWMREIVGDLCQLVQLQQLFSNTAGSTRMVSSNKRKSSDNTQCLYVKYSSSLIFCYIKNSRNIEIILGCVLINHDFHVFHVWTLASAEPTDDSDDDTLLLMVKVNDFGWSNYIWIVTLKIIKSNSIYFLPRIIIVSQICWIICIQMLLLRQTNDVDLIKENQKKAIYGKINCLIGSRI